MKKGFIFPGQGSQSTGMMADLYQSSQAVRDTFQEASDILQMNLWKLVSEGPDVTLNQTANTQPAMLVCGVACFRAWQEKQGGQADIMAGHSLGEYSALVCANALGFHDAVKLVAERGRLMQQAVAKGYGTMAAILGLENDQVRVVCKNSAQGQVVQAVNFNAPGQVVIAGETKAVERAVVAAKDAGARRVMLLPVSVPSHCDLMRPAAAKLHTCITGIEILTPQTRVLHNVDASSHDDSDEIKQVLTEQLYSPVLWADTIRKMRTAGITHMIEMGPGKVLSGLVKRIEKRVVSLPVFDSDSLVKAIETTR